MDTSVPKKKVELHIHLDGAVRHCTAWELAQKKGIKIPGVSSFEEFKNACLVSKPSNLCGFLSKFGVFWPPFEGDLDAIERIAYEFCEDAAKAGIIYAEPRYLPETALGGKNFKELGRQGLDEVITRVYEGLRRGEQDFGVKTKQILCSYYNTKQSKNNLTETLSLCRAHWNHDVVGMDLLTIQPEKGVIEEAPLVEPIISVFREAANAGVHRTVHAGEASSGEAVHRTFYGLGSERVGHGYHVLDNPMTYQKCLEDRYHFECCPYSSLLTGSVKTKGKGHPIVKFARDGINFSVSSDDPTITDHWVDGDFELLGSWGLTSAQLHQATINATEASFLDCHDKNALLKELETL